MIKNTVCNSIIPITVQASHGWREIVGCAMRTEKLQCAGLFRCARRTLPSFRPSDGCAVHSRTALPNTSPRPAPAPVILVRNAG
jgi:hypothetical protein